MSEDDAAQALSTGTELPLPAEDCLFDRYTHEQVGLVRDLLRQREGDLLTHAFRVAIEINYALLGHHWVQENISAQIPTPQDRMQFLKLASTEERDSWLRTDRLIGLADALFCVQWANGFDHKLRELRTIGAAHPEKHLEDIYVELEIGALFSKAGAIVEFLGTGASPSADLRVTFASAEPFDLEIKSKREETVASPNKLKDILEAGAAKFSADKPGVIAVRLPEQWLQESGMREEFTRTIESTLAQSPRTRAVIAVWEEWKRLEQGTARIALYRPFARHGDKRFDFTFSSRLSLSFGTFF